VTRVTTSDGYDLVCVGGGVAGWTAALRAVELGLRVVVVEKHGAGPGWGNGRVSGGFFHAAGLDPRAHDADAILARVQEVTAGGVARPDVARAFARHVRRALLFLESHGAVFAPVAPIEMAANVLQPADRATGEWRHRGPDVLLTGLWQEATGRGVDFRPGRPAVDLVVEGGAVTGVVCAPAGRGGPTETYLGRHVLLADGGFHAAPELVVEHIGPGYLVRGSRGSNQGDALRMGRAVGADVDGLEWFYGHCQVRDALRDERLWPFPSPWPVMAGGVVVDGLGELLPGASDGDESAADAIAKSRTPLGCWVVCTEALWQERASVDALGLGSPRLDPDLLERGGTVVTAPGVVALAAATGLPAEALAVSLAASPSGRIEGPFRALPLVAGITFTMGGLVVDGEARVLRPDGSRVLGLLAAGGAMGGLQGGPGPTRGYCGGWSEAATFGLLAAESAASPTDS
jgi:fumarate reductase flavoprotein subunit